MEFKNIWVCSQICGSGKTSSIINEIKNSTTDNKFIIITPYKEEESRYMYELKSKNFKTPKYEGGHTKLDSIKKLICKGENIISTHALLNRFDQETIDLIQDSSYNICLDETHEVIEPYPLGQKDFQTLMSYCNINPVTKQLEWKESEKDYHDAKFAEEKRLVDLGSLCMYGDNLLCWLFPCKCLSAFKNTIILTYLWQDSLQRAYYSYYGMDFKMISVEGDNKDNYHFVKFNPNKSYIEYDYSKLIHICDNEKLNEIGSTSEFALSKTWYERNVDTANMKTLKDNLYNYFRNIVNAKSSDIIWGTFSDYESKLKGKGFSSKSVYTRDAMRTKSTKKKDNNGNDIPYDAKCGFMPINIRASNKYKQATTVAFLCNRYINPCVKNFFTLNNIEIDEDKWALSEMLQFVFRSALRDGHEINIYVPSSRMRKLLEQWIKDNPKEN